MVIDPLKPTTIQSATLELVSDVQLRLTGSVTTPTAHDELEVYLRALDALIVRGKHRRFTADVRTLTFVNSSAIRLFVLWISWAERGGYRLAFLTDVRNPWQQVSFAALKSLAPGHVDVVEGDSSAAV